MLNDSKVDQGCGRRQDGCLRKGIFHPWCVLNGKVGVERYGTPITETAGGPAV